MSEVTTNKPCPICHSERTRFLFEGWDLQFGHPDSAFVYQCRDCKHIFVAGTLTPEQLTDMYTNYYVRATFNVEDYEPYKEKKRFLYWLDGEEGLAYRHVPENARVLDIGCGYCETLGYHKARGCEVYGVEADENAQKIADRYGFNVHIGLFDPSQYETEFFDYVTMDFVLEHLVNPLKTLHEVHAVLKPGGTLIAAVPNPSAFGRYFFGRYWLQWHFPFHRHFFTQKSISILAEQLGFVVETMRSATKSQNLLADWAFLFCAGAKNKKSATVFQSWGRFDTSHKKRWDVALYLWLEKIRLFSLPMRIADLCGVGDCNIIILKKK